MQQLSHAGRPESSGRFWLVSPHVGFCGSRVGRKQSHQAHLAPSVNSASFIVGTGLQSLAAFEPCDIKFCIQFPTGEVGPLRGEDDVSYWEPLWPAGFCVECMAVTLAAVRLHRQDER